MRAGVEGPVSCEKEKPEDPEKNLLGICEGQSHLRVPIKKESGKSLS
jgi:hypothetical protein